MRNPLHFRFLLLSYLLGLLSGAQAQKAPPAPAARPANLTQVAELTGERLRAVLDSGGWAGGGTSLRNGQVVFQAVDMEHDELMVPLPASLQAAYQRRLRSAQPLLLEVRARVAEASPAHRNLFGLKLDANNFNHQYIALYTLPGREWSLQGSTTYASGTLADDPAAGPAFHTLGLFARGDSLVLYMDDRPVGRAVAAGPAFQALLSRGGRYRLHLYGAPGQTIELSYIRLSAQGEVAAEAARRVAEAAQPPATRAETARSSPAGAASSTSGTRPVPSPTYTTSSGVQYSTADMSMFQRPETGQPQRASRAGEPQVTWLYARTYETALTFSNNTAYQIVYAYVTAPASAAESEVLAAIPESAIRVGVGMRAIGSTVNKCDRSNCVEALNRYSGTYRNVSIRSAGQFRVD